jgi:hypothetical protein
MYKRREAGGVTMRAGKRANQAKRRANGTKGKP